MESHLESTEAIEWRALWRSGDLARFCFISTGILLHATNETMTATVMPYMVQDIAGVQLVGWSLSLYELGAISAAAVTGRGVSYISICSFMILAALIYSAGALVCALAPSMLVFLLGRLLEGAGGGGLVAIAFVSVGRLFPRRIWPQLFAIVSVVWGVSAFAGPLLGAVISEMTSWRWTFAAFSIGGFLMAAASFIVLSGIEATQREESRELPPFPLMALACLFVSVTMIAVAGIKIEPARSSILLALGIAGLGLFLALDARQTSARLFPSKPFDWRTPVGAGMTMITAFAVSTCSFFIYGPLILTSLHGIPVLTTGYIIASESIAWSVLSILVANTPPKRERIVIIGGAFMIAGGLAGFAYAVPAGSIPLILLCAILQGGGFGIAWPFVQRVIVASAEASEQSVAASAVPTMQRVGYATGAALSGIVANASGFEQGLSSETAAAVAYWLFLAFVPVAIVGCIAAIRVARFASFERTPRA